MPSKLLSKSKYLVGLQCPKLLWIEVNEPERLPEIDLATQYVFDQGHIVGELAKKLFPGGIDVPIDKFMDNIKETKELLRQRIALFEAGILSGQTYSRIDILRPAENAQWDIIEVKSSTSVKDINIHDIAFQRYCCELQGVSISRCYLAYINNKYTRNGAIDPYGIFTVEDVTDQVEEFGKKIQDRIDGMLEAISSEKCPDVGIGPHCHDPYQCALTECWDFLPEDNIFNLYRGGKKCFDLYNSGIMTVKDIPDGYKLNQKQRIQQTCEISGQTYADKEAIADFLSTLQYPLYFLDFETFGTAIPLFDGIRPYQNVPFQFSLHVQETPGGQLTHYEHLAKGQKDPRPELLESLSGLIGDSGSIIAYNKSFEENVLMELAQAFPGFTSWIAGAVSRLVDLIVPFRSFHYYHPLQKGSASLKKVLPAITGKGYDDMAIAKGDDASLAYLKVTFVDVSPEEAERVRADLLSYCKLDTEGMVRIIERLGEICV